LLLNLGGPETLADVRPFLYRLFSDPEIIRIKNPALRRMLAWTISRTRARKSRNLYRQIGGGSPLRRITEAQGEALAAELAARGTPARVYVGMLCWKPFIDEAFGQMLADGVNRLVVLPLFPQYSGTTTGACLRRIKALDAQFGLSGKMAISYITEWYDHKLYLEAMTDLIEAGLEKFPEGERGDVHIFYSAHSLPEKYVAAGDPYLDQIKKCVTLINGKLNERLKGCPGGGAAVPHGFSLGFQSKVGPVKWLEPSAEAVLRTLAARGVKRILAVPISFVSDHIETLQELDIAYRRLATELGIAGFQRTAAPNLHPRFIAALADIALGTSPENG
jgi:ferrochelatase